MRSNNTFTYVLYALLGVLLIAAGYLALERRKENALKAEEMRRDQEQLERTLSGMSEVSADTVSGSAYVGESTKKPAASKDGIEDEPATKTPATTKPAATTTATKPAATTTAAAKPATTTAAPTKLLVAKGGTTTTPKSVAPIKTGRYLVVVGAYGQLENARSAMERFVKMGYRDAEVIKYKTDMWRVVAARCAKASAAAEYETDLERQGIDAMVVDSYKK